MLTQMVSRGAQDRPRFEQLANVQRVGAFRPRFNNHVEEGEEFVEKLQA